MIKEAFSAWVDGLIIDRRQRKFLITVGLLEIAMIVSFIAGYIWFAFGCLAAHYFVGMKAIRLKQQWEAERKAAVSSAYEKT